MADCQDNLTALVLSSFKNFPIYDMYLSRSNDDLKFHAGNIILAGYKYNSYELL